MSNEIAGIIVEKRKALRMTQRDLAEKLNVSDQTVSRWETGSSYPDATIIPALAAALEIDINALFSRSSGETLSKADAIDHGKTTKFEILLLVASVLMILAAGLSVALCSLNWNIRNDAVIILTAAFWIIALAGFTLCVCSSIWFRGFYKGKFFTEQYRLVDYRFNGLWLLSACLMAMSYTTIAAPTSHIVLQLLSNLIPGLFLGLAMLIAKLTRINIRWDARQINLLILGLVLPFMGSVGFYIEGCPSAASALGIAIYAISELLAAASLSWFAMRAKPKPDSR